MENYVGYIMTNAKYISLIVPVFNEEFKTLELFAENINKLFFLLKDTKFELIFIDDSTKFQCREYTKKICELNSWKGIFFTRNFGKEAAIRAGIERATGSAIIILDVDLQDPIELIPRMIDIWHLQKVPVVLAKRINRKSDSYLKRSSARVFYKVINRLAEVEIPADVGDFRLLDRKVVESALLLNERNIFMKGIWAWIGYPSVTLEYTRPGRDSGKSKFSAKRLFRIATDGIVSFSSLPLRLWSYLGVIIAGFTTLYLCSIVIKKIIGVDMETGYASIIVISTFSLSINLICFGIFGEYLSRMFLEVKARPHYIVLEEIN